MMNNEVSTLLVFARTKDGKLNQYPHLAISGSFSLPFPVLALNTNVLIYWYC